MSDTAVTTITVHETAIVEPGSTIGPGTAVWHFAHVRAGSQIGADCMLAKGVYVGESAKIGNRVRVQNGVNVFNGVTLEDEVFVGPGVVFTNDRFPRAVNLIDPDFATTIVRRGATLGGGCVIVAGVEIGACAMIGAGSVVTRSVLPYQCVTGNPARPRGWVCRCGRSLQWRSETGWACGVCRRIYVGTPDQVTEISSEGSDSES